MRTALVTGAASGIGRCFAETLAGQKYGLVLFDLDENGLRETERLVASRAAATQVAVCDVSERQAIERSVTELLPSEAGLDLLIHCAAILAAGSWAHQPAETFEKAIDVDLLGTVNTVRAALPSLRRARGQIVILASTAALHGWPQLAAYSAAKFALVGYSEAIRAELAREGIGLTVAFPLLIDTPLLHGPDLPPILRRGRRIPPSTVVRKVLRAAARRDSRVYIPGSVRVVAALHGIAPSVLDWYGRRFGTE